MLEKRQSQKYLKAFFTFIIFNETQCMTSTNENCIHYNITEKLTQLNTNSKKKLNHWCIQMFTCKKNVEFFYYLNK